jgi:hypothetical protein
MTMSQHAVAERGQPPAQGGGGFVEPAVELGPNQIPMGPANLGILPTDELPPQAKSDPAFVSGTGSMFAANQPHLAMKYGVVRRGKLVSPQQLNGAPQKAQLRPETIRDLQELNKLNELQTRTAVPEQPGSSEMGRAAGEVGISPGQGKVFSAEEREELKNTLENLDDFDFDRWRQSMQRDVLNNEKQKELIESRLKPMDIGDLITQGYLIQRVEIIPGRFWFEFKTLDAETDLALKRILMEDSRSLEVSDRYFLDKFGLMSVAAVLNRINDKPYGEITNDKGNFDDDLFRAKFSRVMKLPMPMLSCIGANAFWFDLRVRKLFVAEAVGNG